MTYLTRPVFEFAINWRETPVEHFAFDLNQLELGYGTPFFETLQSHVVRGFSFELYLGTAAAIAEFDDFVAGLVGRLNGFWLPAPLVTLQIVGAVSATQFDIADQNLRDTLAAHPDVHLWLSRPGNARPCKIAAVALQSAGIERVTLTAGLATPATPADTAVRLHYVRLATDQERARFVGEGKQKREVRVVELPHEYAAYETGTRPIYLYHFWADVPMETHWYYTSFAADVVSADQKFAAFPINHGALRKSARLDRDTLELEARYDLNHPLALFLPTPFARPLNVSVSQCSYSDPDTSELLFTGTVRRVPDLGDRVKAEANAWTQILSRKVPAMLIGPEDNYDIFDETTGAVARWRYEITATVVAVNPETLPPTIRVSFDFPESAQYANWIAADWFASGFIECGSGVSFAVRGILSSTAVGAGTPKDLELELNEPVNPAVGSKVQVIPGYDGSLAQRRDKFNDFANFGGFIAIPEQNPSLASVDSSVSAGGKK